MTSDEAVRQALVAAGITKVNQWQFDKLKRHAERLQRQALGQTREQLRRKRQMSHRQHSDKASEVTGMWMNVADVTEDGYYWYTEGAETYLMERLGGEWYENYQPGDAPGRFFGPVVAPEREGTVQ